MYVSVSRQRLNTLEPNLEAFVEDLDPTDIVHLETNHSAQKKRKGEKLRPSKDNASSDSAAHESTAPKAGIYVVPSGQVYRQLFDAGAQLRRAYDMTRGSVAELTAEDTHAISASNGLPLPSTAPGSVPLVRITRDPLTEGTGILSVRQQNWLATLPFEANVENPTTLRHTTDNQISSDREEENDDSPTREVQNLPDVVEHHKKGSNIISRISKSRRERHERACDEMHQLLVLTATEFEPKLEAIGSDLTAKLSENDRQLEVALARLEPEAGLYGYAFSEMQQIWQDIEATASFRKEWIEEAHSKLQQTEDERTLRIATVMRQQSTILEKISHLPKLDLEKYMDELSQLINQIILSNRRAYVNLQLRVRTANIDQEKRMHDFYVMRLNEWKQFQVTRSIDIFRTFMMTEAIARPPNVGRHIAELVQELEEINRKRMDLLESLTGFKPPSSTKRYIYQWNDKINALTGKLNSLVNSRMEKVFIAYEAASQQCAQKATDIRRSLIEACVMTEREADELVSAHLIPIIGERQRMYEEQMEVVNEEIEQQSDQINRELKLLFTFCQGAAHLWDVHEVSLAQTERALQERLHVARRDHDAENQDRENHLDIVMDRMRQDSGEQNLQKNLRRVREQLEQIKEMYKKFHSDQLELVQSYPYMVKDAILDYDTAVKRYFSLDVNPPGNQADEPRQDDVSVTSAMQQHSDPSLDDGGNRSAAGQQRPPDTIADGAVPPPLLGNAGDVVRSDNGKCFYVVAPSLTSRRRSTPMSRNSVTATCKEEFVSNTRQAFLTEAETPADPLSGKKYLTSFYIGSDYFERIKKCIRLSFVNHLENWSESAMQRAHSIVAAKCEELHSELELRLHLHAPRVKRAEVDVHNVRAAELVLHNERVQRHCKGIAQSLAELKNRFEGLTVEHQKMFEKFQKEADGMDSLIIEATKSAKLAEMQTRLQRIKDKFLDGVRQSLRNFRHTLDSELQMLRESNANFIKSFRLFSDGGNFCPEEIDGFRKRLDKCSHKIDDSEGAIMSELEGVESKWLHKAAHLYNDFEDRFRHHMTDLVFMEKVARWLTNTQVKIKVEVAESNGQAQKLAHLMTDLERRLSACEEPHPDKEVVSSSDLYASLKPLFTAFHGRCSYLDCAIKEALTSSTSSEEFKDSKAGPKGVGFTDSIAVSGLPTMQTSTKAGSKVTNEDPTISAIKNIYRMQKPATAAVAIVSGAAATGQAPAGDSQLAASAQATTDGGDATNIGKLNNDDVSAIRNSADKQQLPSNADRGQQQQHQHVKGSRQGIRARGTPTATSTAEPIAVASNNRHSSAVRRVNRFDRREKRFQLFPDENVSEEDAVEARNTTFLGKIKYILHEAQDGLFEAAELYYRQKGVRAVTRPQALQETMELCAEIITEKLRSYYNQCDTYHNECLQEFRMQLANTERLTARIPPLVLSDLTRTALAQIKRTTEELLRSFTEQESKLEQRKSEHKTLLRPTLGHPNLAEKMNVLCQNEEIRTKETLVAFDQLEKGLRELSEKHATEFVASLADKSVAIMNDFDSMLTVDDTIKGKLIPKKYPTTELLRRNQCGLPLDDVIPDTLMQRGKRSWDGLVKNELVAFGKPAKKLTTPTLVTAKTTMGHHACQEAKLKYYQDYKLHFESLLDQIAERKAEQIRSEERWYSSWQVAVSKIRTLYRE